MYKCQRGRPGREGRALHRCQKWVEEELEGHFQQHLADETPLKCNIIKFRSVFIQAGLCPFCLRKEDLPAAERLKR